ncbi:MAG: hypothetical protein ABIH71_00795 [Candidatus Omnitrophota bacterium]|nr:hypothetical protein [Candidatus Omnitrophota bacterium]
MVKKSNCCSGKSPKGKNLDTLKTMVDKVWPKTKKDLEEVVHKVWPKTKKELEVGLKNTKELIAKGEKYIKEISDKSVKSAKKLSLNLKKEKLYYDLGKSVAMLSAEAWSSDKKINAVVKEIKSLEREVKSIK